MSDINPEYQMYSPPCMDPTAYGELVCGFMKKLEPIHYII